MLKQYHCKSNNFKFQLRIRYRRNVTQSKLNDAVILSLLCWQVSLDITNQFRFYSFLKNIVFKPGQILELSRFNRICCNALFSLQYMRMYQFI